MITQASSGAITYIQRNRLVINLPNNWRCFASAAELAEFTCQSILEIAQEAIQKRGAFHFVTAGGTTPLQVYQLLAAYEKNALGTSQPMMDWSKWHIYIGDERCLPVDDAERNSLALQNNWLKYSQIPTENIHFMPAELGAKQAALRYQSVVENLYFDVVLLGMGEDGHTASLFPGHSHQHEAENLVQTEFNSPKPPSERVTLSVNCLGNSHHLFKLITGTNKQAAVQQWLAGETLPISQVCGEDTQVLISIESCPLT